MNDAELVRRLHDLAHALDEHQPALERPVCSSIVASVVPRTRSIAIHMSPGGLGAATCRRAPHTDAPAAT